MSNVSKEMLNQALEAWSVAREKAGLGMQAWVVLTQSHGTLIASLLQHGHTWSQAEAEFARLSTANKEDVQGAWKEVDALCREYQSLLAQFKSQDS